MQILGLVVFAGSAIASCLPSNPKTTKEEVQLRIHGLLKGHKFEFFIEGGGGGGGWATPPFRGGWFYPFIG